MKPAAPTPAPIKAIIFDIGGVCVHSPLQGIRKYEETHGLPMNYLNVAISSQGENGAFQRLERGELTTVEFYPLFGREIGDSRNVDRYVQYLKRKGLPIPKEMPENIKINGEELFKTMMSESTRPDWVVLNAVRKLRDTGRFKVAALTNNYLQIQQPQQLQHSRHSTPTTPNNNNNNHNPTGVPDWLKSQFHHFIESAVVGLRKPDPRFYEYACRVLGVRPGECVFLDDIGGNLKTAEKLGMRTIQVKIGKSREAIRELERVVGVSLLDVEGGNQSKL